MAKTDSSRIAPARATTAQPNGTTPAGISHETPARRVPLEQLHALLSEAAILADETDESCKSIPNEFDEDQILRHLDRLRDIVCRLGWMADMSLKVIGERAIRGDAEQWLISFIARGEDNNQFLVLQDRRDAA